MRKFFIGLLVCCVLSATAHADFYSGEELERVLKVCTASSDLVSNSIENVLNRAIAVRKYAQVKDYVNFLRACDKYDESFKAFRYNRNLYVSLCEPAVLNERMPQKLVDAWFALKARWREFEKESEEFAELCERGRNILRENVK